VGWDRSVGIATGYGLDGPGIEFWWGRDFPHLSWGPPSLLYNGYRVFPGGKERPGRDADPSPPSSAVGHERVELYLYSPYGLYGACTRVTFTFIFPIYVKVSIRPNLRNIKIYRKFSVLMVFVPNIIVGAVRYGDRMPEGARFSAPVRTGLAAHPACCILGTRLIHER